MVTIKFSTTKKDLFYFYDYISRHHKLGRRVTRYIVIFLCIFLSFYRDIFYEEKYEVIVLFSIFFIVMLFFGFTGYGNLLLITISGNLKQILGKLQKQVVVFDDKEILHTVHDGSKVTTPYSTITKTIITKHAIYLFISNGCAYLIPINAFKNHADLEFAKNKLSK